MICPFLSYILLRREWESPPVDDGAQVPTQDTIIIPDCVSEVNEKTLTNRWVVGYNMGIGGNDYEKASNVCDAASCID